MFEKLKKINGYRRLQITGRWRCITNRHTGEFSTSTLYFDKVHGDYRKVGQFVYKYYWKPKPKRI